MKINYLGLKWILNLMDKWKYSVLLDYNSRLQIMGLDLNRKMMNIDGQ